jgi:HlyD family secretion protein
MHVVALLCLLLPLAGCSDREPSTGKQGSLTLFGNVDIREVQLAFQDGGRILSLHVDEGDQVKKGDVVAELDPSRFRMEVDRLSGEVIAQTRVLERLKSGSRPQEIEQAKAAVASARANLKEAELVLARKRSLLVTNRISQQEVDSALARVQTLQAALKTSEEQQSLAIEGPRREDIEAAEANLTALQSAKDLANQRLSDSRLVVPATGYIRNRILEPGAMAVAGAPVLTLALTDPLWIRGYISEPDLGKVREGMAAQIHTDSQPGTTYKGWVGFIASTAEFTPKTVETTELRTKLVYRARIFACDPEHELRLGMPVTVTIDTAQPATGQGVRCE